MKTFRVAGKVAWSAAAILFVGGIKLLGQACYLLAIADSTEEGDDMSLSNQLGANAYADPGRPTFYDSQ